MKKNFFRVKQIVDQTVAGAEQSEAFTEDVQAAEKHVELLKQTCGVTSKKIGSLLSKTEGNHEKRLKKIPESAIGNTMFECGTMLGERSILKDMLLECGQLGTKLGWEMLAHEIELEKTVVDPLMAVENEANNIVKARKSLSKLILDMDSARSRYRNAQKTASSAGNTSKINLIKDELEEAVQKVEQNRDALAADIYTLLSREAEFAKIVLTFAESQRRYHEAALKVLDSYIPSLEAKWKTSSQKPVFGCDVDEHLRTSGRTIAHPIEVCVITLYETGMEEEGVFRIAGGASKVRKFRAALDANVADLGFALELRDVHTVAGILKSYLRELPDPILCSSLYDDWIDAVKTTELDARLLALAEVVRKLPDGRRQNVRYLMRFFLELSRKQELNKMTPQNLAIVLAPCLIWPSGDDEALGVRMSLANLHSAVVEHLITFAERLFPGEFEYYATYSKALYASMLLPPSPVNGGFTDRDEADSKDVTLRKTHQRIGSNEGIVDLRQSFHPSLNDNSVALGSPRPIVRKKNKPAPAVPEPPNPAKGPATSPAKTPDKEERPSLPPTGPDVKRISALPPDKPKLAPRPSLSNTSHYPHIGFEGIEHELRRVGSVKQPVRKAPPVVNKSDDEGVEMRRSVVKRATLVDGATMVPHPNAVSVFGGLPPPERKSDVEKPKPQVPERPSLSKVAQTAAHESQSEVKVSEVTTSKKASVVLNATDHPDIEFADSDEPQQVNKTPPQTIEKRERPPKPERPEKPEKPERLSQPVESNNNKNDEEPDKRAEESQSNLPRPAPRSSVPAVRPRTSVASAEVETVDCTDF